MFMKRKMGLCLKRIASRFAPSNSALILTTIFFIYTFKSQKTGMFTQKQVQDVTWLSITKILLCNNNSYSLSRRNKKHIHINSKNQRMNRGNFILEAKFPSNSSNGNTSLTRQHQYKIDAFKFLFGNIAAFSFLGNLLLSMAICRRRQLLLKTYNLLVLNLAITDMLTGLFPVRVSVCCCN